MYYTFTSLLHIYTPQVIFMTVPSEISKSIYLSSVHSHILTSAVSESGQERIYSGDVHYTLQSGPRNMRAASNVST